MFIKVGKNIVGKKFEVAYYFTRPYPMIYKLTFIERNKKCFDTLIKLRPAFLPVKPDLRPTTLLISTPS